MNKLMNVAIKFLAEYPHTEYELRCRLEEYCEFAAEQELAIQKTLEQLRQLQLFNDTRVANVIALRYANKGNEFIFQLLQQKGLSKETIMQALGNLGDEYTRALKVARKKLQEVENEPSDQIKRFLSEQVKRFLNGRSFSPNTIRKVCHTLSC